MTRTQVSHMLLWLMGSRRKTKFRPTRPMSLSARVNLLSPKRREIVRPAFNQPRECVLLSIRALAKRLKTDPATMVRIVRAMQFGSYREFQHYLHELSIAHATSLDTMKTSSAKYLTVPAQVRASLDQDVKNLHALARSLEARRITGLARRFWSARRVVVLGGDLAATLVKLLEYELTILGLPITSATSPGEAMHKARHVRKKDLVIAVSYGRGLRQTVEGLRLARANGAYCVGITDTLVSPIVQFAHECFIMSVDTPSFAASYVAPIAFFNVLVAACGNYRRARTLALLKKMEEEERHGFRWYES